MNNQMQIFENDTFGELQVLEIEGNPWFIGKEVADILGYTNAPKAIRDHVDDEDKLTERIVLSGQNRSVTIINESGLYALIFGSKLPTARAFKRWVTNIVLPSIRKHGAYISPEVLEEMLVNTDFAKTVVRELHAEQSKNEALLDRVEELAPKAKYCDQILRCQNALPVSIIAKDYGMSAVGFNRLLHRLGVQYRVGPTWVLYQQFTDLGYTKSNTYYTPIGNGIVHTSWTQCGRMFLYEVLAAAGIFPAMDSEVC